MTTYSYAQLKGLWMKASQGTKYHSNTWASLMAAIAEAESGGNSDALNPDDNHGTQSSFGLWQISTGTHAPPSPNWADPATNAHLAIEKLNGTGLSAWGTYDSGAYKAYLNDGTAPDPNVPGNPGGKDIQLTAAQAQDCAISLNLHVGLIFNFGPTLASQCLITKGQVRALMGAGFLVGGSLLMLGGVGLLAAAAAVRVAAPVIAEINRVPVAGSYSRAVTQRASQRLSYTPPKKQQQEEGAPS